MSPEQRGNTSQLKKKGKDELRINTCLVADHDHHNKVPATTDHQARHILQGRIFGRVHRLRERICDASKMGPPGSPDPLEAERRMHAQRPSAPRIPAHRRASGESDQPARQHDRPPNICPGRNGRHRETGFRSIDILFHAALPWSVAQQRVGPVASSSGRKTDLFSALRTRHLNKKACTSPSTSVSWNPSPS